MNYLTLITIGMLVLGIATAPAVVADENTLESDLRTTAVCVSADGDVEVRGEKILEFDDFVVCIG